MTVEQMRVDYTPDGDTIKVFRTIGHSAEEVRIRLAYMDAPELSDPASYPYAVSARAYLRRLLALNETVEARIHGTDAYGRLIADARRALRPVKWAVSLGTDTEGRRLAIEQAAHLGRLPLHQARALLAANGLPTAALPSPTAHVGTLPANVYAIPDLEHREAARFLATVRAGLAEADARANAGQDMQTWQRQHVARGQDRRKGAALSALEHLRLSLDTDATGIV